MIKIPAYIECLATLVKFLGLDYSESEKSTGKFRISERSDFVNQGDTYTKNYVPKILDLFAGEDKEKRELIKLFLVMSESLVRDLTRKNYYTLASQKRGMWGLLVFYYIPHIACLMSIYKKEFGIPDCLIANDFMLPFVDDKGKVVSPTLRLIRYLTPIERAIPSVKYQDEKDNLNDYIKNLSKKLVPSYRKHQDIIERLNAIKNEIPELKNKIPEIDLTFRTAIISGHIYRELLELFDESYAISLIDYFKQCLKSSKQFFDGIESNRSFDSIFCNYLSYYKYEFDYTLTTHKAIGLHFPFKTPEGDDVLYGHDELKEQREEFRKDIFKPFNSFLEITKSDTKNDLFEIDTKDLIKSSPFLKPFDFSDLSKMSGIKSLLSDLDDVFLFQKGVIPKNTVNELLQEFKNHPFYATYEHEYLYYDSLNDLGKNNFESALTKLNQAAEKCMTITAGETQLRIAEKLIALTLLAKPNFVFESLNPSIRLMIDAEPEKELLIILPFNTQQEISEEEKHRQIYFSKALGIMARFNSEGYARYEDTQCKKYNPFEKVESLIGDFYELHDDNSQIFESEKNKVQNILTKLTKGRGAKYPIDKNLITFYQYKAIDVFAPVNFTTIYLFCFDCKIDNKNIFKLLSDQKTLNLIFEVVST